MSGVLVSTRARRLGARNSEVSVSSNPGISEDSQAELSKAQAVESTASKASSAALAQGKKDVRPARKVRRDSFAIAIGTKAHQRLLTSPWEAGTGRSSRSLPSLRLASLGVGGAGLASLGVFCPRFARRFVEARFARLRVLARNGRLSACRSKVAEYVQKGQARRKRYWSEKPCPPRLRSSSASSRRGGVS